MDAFHLVIDTSVLRRAHFQHPDFEKLLLRARKGTLKIYIPHIVLEEERTHMVEKLLEDVAKLTTAYDGLAHRPYYQMFVKRLPTPHLVLWEKEEIIRHSRLAFDKFLADNKIEKLPMTEQHGINAWGRYFDIAPPFDEKQERTKRREHIPDSWILEAALAIKERTGHHCALVGDDQLQAAFEGEGFKVFRDVTSLDAEIEKTTAVSSGLSHTPVSSATPLDQLRSDAFKDVALIVLGINEALNTPVKHELFTQLERVGIDRRIAEHEAQTLVLSGRLDDVGNHYIPRDRALARNAAKAPAVTAILLRISSL